MFEVGVVELVSHIIVYIFRGGGVLPGCYTLGSIFSFIYTFYILFLCILI